MAKSRLITCLTVAVTCGVCWFVGATKFNGFSNKGLVAAAIITACCMASASVGMALGSLARRPRQNAEPGAAADGRA